jgi:hypothetical protein
MPFVRREFITPLSARARYNRGRSLELDFNVARASTNRRVGPVTDPFLLDFLFFPSSSGLLKPVALGLHWFVLSITMIVGQDVHQMVSPIGSRSEGYIVFTPL